MNRPVIRFVGWPSPVGKRLLLAALLLAALLPASPAAGQIAVGTKEVLLDSMADFNHHSGSQVKLWKGTERVLENGLDPVGYYHDLADLSDPKLILTDQTSGYIAKITTLQRPTPNTTTPEVGELRLAGWKSVWGGTRTTSDAFNEPDSWNRWDVRVPNPATLIAGPSHPVGGLNYILQSFKVYKTGALDKIRLKVRRHPGVAVNPGHPGLYVAILADDGTGHNPKTYGGTVQKVNASIKPAAADPAATFHNHPSTYPANPIPPRAPDVPMKEIVLGFAHVPDNKIGSSTPDGTHAFETIDVAFTGINRPMLVANKLYWMKISTMPYTR